MSLRKGIGFCQQSSGSNDPLFLLTPQLLTTELITSLNENIRNMV